MIYQEKIMKALIVEDDPGIARTLQVNLELEGFESFWATSLSQAFEKESEHQIDLVLLDLGLGTESGFKFLEHMMAKKSRVPVIILSAQTDEDSVVKGLEMGAKDYLRKPFGTKELIARIKSVTRIPQKHDEKINYAGLCILTNKRSIQYNERHINLNRREFDILNFLIENADNIVSRETLVQAIDKDAEIFDRTIDSHISHLRKKLKKEQVDSIKISSVYGVGYRLEKR